MGPSGKNGHSSELTEEQQQREAAPRTDWWLTNELRIAATFLRDDEGDAGRLAAIVALSAVSDYLESWPDVKQEGLLRPLANLHGALLDLERGGKPLLLRPPAGRKKLTTPEKAMRAVAAFAIDMHMKAGKDEIAACAAVARELNRQGWRRAGDKPVDATTVQNWRKAVKGGSISEDDETGHYRHLRTAMDGGDTPVDPVLAAKRMLRWLADRYPARPKS